MIGTKPYSPVLLGTFDIISLVSNSSRKHKIYFAVAEAQH